MMTESIAWLNSWLTGSTLQTAIIVSGFWLAFMVAILALVGSNRRGRDLDAAGARQIEQASEPAPLHPATMDHAYMHREVRKVRGLSS